MTLPHLATSDELARHAGAGQHALDAGPPRESTVSWAAIFAGAAAAAALSLILLMLGVGLGLSSVSPWAHEGVSATTIGVSTIVWLGFTQLAASGMGGYLAGRLRPRWWAAQPDEVYFRDTAHGFLAWAVASLATAALLGSAVGAITGSGAQAGATLAAGAATATTAAATSASGSPGAQEAKDYYVDALFRPAAAAGAASAAQAPALPPSATPVPAAESARIFAAALAGGALPAADASHLAQLVSQRTGIGAHEAQERVTQTFERFQAKARETETAAREAADKARKASAYAALWMFVSLLIGAFVASLMATFGGRQRDEA